MNCQSIYNNLLQKYNELNDTEKQAILIYKSKLFYFINEIAMINNFLDIPAKEILENIKAEKAFCNKFEEYRKVVNSPINLFAKNAIFATVKFDNIFDFIDSLKETYIHLIKAKEKITLEEDLTVYRMVSLNNNNLSPISKSNIISTSIKVEDAEKFIEYKHNHLYQMKLQKGTKVLVTPYSLLIDLDKNIFKIEKLGELGQQEIIIFKSDLSFNEYDIKTVDIDNYIINIHKVDTIPLKKGTSIEENNDTYTGKKI
jgi:hypothetical protein